MNDKDRERELAELQRRSAAISNGQCPNCRRPLIPERDTPPSYTGALCPFCWELFETNSYSGVNVVVETRPIGGWNS